VGGKVMREGDVRANLATQRFVRLVCLQKIDAPHPTLPLARVQSMGWEVEDLLTEERYTLDSERLGPLANEMEVIAWAAK